MSQERCPDYIYVFFLSSQESTNVLNYATTVGDGYLETFADRQNAAIVFTGQVE